MNTGAGYYSRPVLVACLFSAVLILAFFLVRDFSVGTTVNTNYHIFSVKFEHYGIDSTEIEKSITIPLETALRGFNGLLEIRSVSEYSKVTTSLFFSRSYSLSELYTQLRDVVDTVYRTLPASVQKPVIYSSSSTQDAVMMVALQSPSLDVDTLRFYADRTIKPAIERIDGVAHVNITGGSMLDVLIEFDIGKTLGGGVDPVTLGRSVSSANVISSSGKVGTDHHSKPLIFFGRLSAISDFAQIPVPKGQTALRLDTVSFISEKARSRDEIVRVNGQECVVVAIMSTSEGNPVSISREVLSILPQTLSPDMNIVVLTDSGKKAQSMINTALGAVAQSFFLVLLFLPLFLYTTSSVFLVASVLPVSMFLVLAILNRLGIGLDQNSLAGITIALGLIIDAPIVIATVSRTANPLRFYCKVKTLAPPLLLSMATSILVILPLLFMDFLIPGIRGVMVSIILLLAVSTALTLLVLPAFLVVNAGPVNHDKRSHLFGISRTFDRLLYRIYWFFFHSTRKYKRIFVFLFGLLALVPMLLMIISAKTLTFDSQDDFLRVVVEFDPEKRALAVEEICSPLVMAITALPEIAFVQTTARKGAMELFVGLQRGQQDIPAVSARIRGLSHLCGDGFLFIPVNSDHAGEKIASVEVAVVGDESEQCRAIAKLAARASRTLPEVKQSVLNFKDPEMVYHFIPNRSVVARNGMTPAVIADTLRWIIHGPVVDKWLHDGKETDIRVAGYGIRTSTLDDILNVYIPASEGGIRLATLGTVEKRYDGGKIYRIDGRRAAFFTLEAAYSSTDRLLKKMQNFLNTIERPWGYVFRFSREFEEQSTKFRTFWAVLGITTLGLLVLLTMLTEQPLRSLVIAAVIPVSSCLPLMIRFCTGTPLSLGDIVGMVVLSGLSVNNAILVAETRQEKTIYQNVRAKFPSIVATSLTSIAGAVPMLLWGQGNLVKSLSFFMLWGILSSMFASVLLFPAVIHTLEAYNLIRQKVQV